MAKEEKANDRCDERGHKQASSAKPQSSVWKRLSKIGTQYGYSLRLASMVMPLILLCLLAGVTLAVTFNSSIKNYGTLKYVGVSVYWDNACTNQVTSIPWGTITLGAQVDNTLYVKNVGNAAGTLSMNYGNFTPTVAASYLALTWNCSSYVLPSNSVTCAKLILTVQPNITGVTDFSFDILVEATV
jgi:hypothetical protein